MVDRAHYIARRLIERLANLHARSAEDHRDEPDRQRRIEVIEKVMVVELGVTDGATLALIEAAVPNLKATQEAPEREVAVLAEFLRQRLGTQLVAPS